MSGYGRVILVLRDGLPPTAGNRTTAERLAAGLRARGFSASIREAGDLPAASGPPTIYHALHALGAGPAALHRARPGVDSVVVTLTGTDAGDGPSPDLAAVLGRCDAVVTFHPDPVAAAIIIPPGMAPLPGRSRRATWGVSADDTVFLLPAGVRPVKDPSFALAPLGRLRAEGRPVRLLIAGPARDADETADLVARLRAAGPWASYLGEVARARMGDLYRSADVVLNTSRVEGLSNAVLEAMACARPVLVSDILGNRAAVEDGRSGLLYRAGDAEDFAAKAARLADDPALRRRLGRAGARHVAVHFAPDAEIERLIGLYASLPAAVGSAEESACTT
jgi:glycosyltransferase involved in cell wall biosynthesis